MLAQKPGRLLAPYFLRAVMKRRSCGGVLLLVAAGVSLASHQAFVQSWHPAWRRRSVTTLQSTFEIKDLPSECQEWAATNLIDEEAKIAESNCAFKPEELVKRAKYVLAANNGYIGEEGGLMSDDFEFAGPVVGPLNKQQFLDAIRSFNLAAAFPDALFEFYDFRVDAYNPYRVWFTSRGEGTQTEPAPSLGIMKATGKSYVNPPQTCSVRFNDEGKVCEYTIGYVMNRREGNTGGLGGIYGILNAIGKPFPFPEARPYKKSWQLKAFQAITGLLQKLRK